MNHYGASKRSASYNYNKMQEHYKLRSRLFDDDEYCNHSCTHTGTSFECIYDECHLLILPFSQMSFTLAIEIL